MKPVLNLSNKASISASPQNSNASSSRDCNFIMIEKKAEQNVIKNFMDVIVEKHKKTVLNLDDVKLLFSKCKEILQLEKSGNNEHSVTVESACDKKILTCGKVDSLATIEKFKDLSISSKIPEDRYSVENTKLPFHNGSDTSVSTSHARMETCNDGDDLNCPPLLPLKKRIIKSYQFASNETISTCDKCKNSFQLDSIETNGKSVPSVSNISGCTPNNSYCKKEILIGNSSVQDTVANFDHRFNATTARSTLKHKLHESIYVKHKLGSKNENVTKKKQCSGNGVDSSENAAKKRLFHKKSESLQVDLLNKTVEIPVIKENIFTNYKKLSVNNSCEDTTNFCSSTLDVKLDVASTSESPIKGDKNKTSAVTKKRSLVNKKCHNNARKACGNQKKSCKEERVKTKHNFSGKKSKSDANELIKLLEAQNDSVLQTSLVTAVNKNCKAVNNSTVKRSTEGNNENCASTSAADKAQYRNFQEVSKKACDNTVATESSETGVNKASSSYQTEGEIFSDSVYLSIEKNMRSLFGIEENSQVSSFCLLDEGVSGPEIVVNTVANDEDNISPCSANVNNAVNSENILSRSNQPLINDNRLVEISDNRYADNSFIEKQFQVLQNHSNIQSPYSYSLFNIQCFTVVQKSPFAFLYYCFYDKCNFVSGDKNCICLHIEEVHFNPSSLYYCNLCDDSENVATSLSGLFNHLVLHLICNEDEPYSSDHEKARKMSKMLTYDYTELAEDPICDIKKHLETKCYSILNNESTSNFCSHVLQGEQFYETFDYLIDFFKCIVGSCSFSCNDLTVYNLHCKSHSKNNGVEQTDEFNTDGNYVYTCPYCDTFTKLPSDHLIKYHGSSIYQCPLCFYRAYSALSVAIHQVKFHPSKVVRIAIVLVCSKKYHSEIKTVSSNLEKSFHCFLSDCNFSSHILSNFVTHLWSHSFRMLSCFECGAKIHSLKNYISHLDLHGIRMYNCSYCSNSYSLQDKAVDHVMHCHKDLPPRLILRCDYNDSTKLAIRHFHKFKAVKHGNEELIEIELDSIKSLKKLFNPVIAYGRGERFGQNTPIIRDINLNIARTKQKITLRVFNNISAIAFSFLRKVSEDVKKKQNTSEALTVDRRNGNLFSG